MIHYYFLPLLPVFVGETIPECSRGPYTNLCALSENEYNSTRAEGLCDCQQVRYCSVFEVSPECNAKTVKLDLNPDHDVKCQLSPSDSPDFEFVNVTEGSISVISVEMLSEPGKYIIACAQPADSVNESWEVEGVTPAEVSVGSHVQLQVTVGKNGGNNSMRVWCLIKTPDSDVEILSAAWLSETQIECSEFQPTASGLFRVGVTTNLKMNDFSDAKLSVTPKRPVATLAEYGPDLQTIYIHFDQNVEAESNCERAFSASHQFGAGFTCSTRGNVLRVNMGSGSQQPKAVEITATNQIYPVGAGVEYSATPATLTVSEKRVSRPSLSFYFINTPCETNTTEKYSSIKVVSGGTAKPPVSNTGKNHRKNLMMWRTMRRSKITAQADILPVLESIVSYDSFLQGDNNTRMSAAVSVTVQSPPTTSLLVAEANVTFCAGTATLFHYRWFVNEAPAEDGRFLKVENLPPGKHLIRCLVVADSSEEILGQGWAITELVESPEKAIISPAEIAVGAADDIVLRVVSGREKSISWTCRTFLEEPCNPKSNLDLNSPILDVPAGTLPPGRYVWSVGDTHAKVIIKPEKVPAVDVEPPPVFVSSSETVILNGTVKGYRQGCLAWWTCLRQTGFDYVKLQPVTVEPHGEHVPLEIPPGRLEAGSSLLLKLEAVCPDSGSSHVSVPIAVNDPPAVSPLIVEPTSGKALITDFSVSQVEAKDSAEDFPLQYEWSYLDSCETEIPIARGASPRRVTTYLPPGDIRLIVRVCDARQTCSVASSPVIPVSRSADVPRENIRQTRNEIRHLMATGDTREAFGLATTILKSLALTAETEAREEVYQAVEEAVKTRVAYLRSKMESESEFLDQAAGMAKFFRKGSGFLEYLKAARHPRRTRNSDPEEAALFRLHSRTLEANDTMQNRMELMKDVRKFMLTACSGTSDSSHVHQIDSQIVNIRITKVIPEADSNKTFSFPGGSEFKLRFGGKLLRGETCLCVAAFARDLLGNTKESRLTRVYEVQAIKSGKFVKGTRNGTLALGFPLSDPPGEGIDCMTWTRSAGWSSRCRRLEDVTREGVVCGCREFGYHSAFLRNPRGGGRKSHSGGSATPAVLSEWDACISFKIREDFAPTAGADSTALSRRLRRQIADQLRIPREAISYLFIKPGSIRVTVFFVDVHETKAEAAVKELANLLQEGKLRLTSPDKTRLAIDRDHPKTMVSPPRSRNGAAIGRLAYGALAGTILAIAAAASTVAVLRKKGGRAGVRPPPSDGPAAYRRNPLRTD